jgi:Bacterial CdiA-CT RNAse A domain
MKTKRMKRWVWVLSAYGLIFFVSGCGQNPGALAQQDPSSGETKATSSQASNSLRRDLSIDEGRGGHTLKKHIGETDDELLRRLRKERNISAASTWTDLDAAEETVGKALQADHGRIEDWERRGFPRPNLALHFDSGRVVGRSIKHGESESSPCTRAVIVLKADAASFYVLTTYPEDRN